MENFQAFKQNVILLKSVLSSLDEAQLLYPAVHLANAIEALEAEMKLQDRSALA
jgi:hypothetical protein